MTLREKLVKEAINAGIDPALAFFAAEAVRYYEDETHFAVVALKGQLLAMLNVSLSSNP